MFEFEILFEDGTTAHVKVKATDIVAFERKFKMGIQALEGDFHLEHMLFLGFTAQRRVQATALDFEAWINTVDSIEAVDDVDPSAAATASKS
jgi:hypothetical protein